jgi:hypothetical protein
MKVGDLIKVLQGLNPESSVTLSLGRDDEYRTLCAKAELAYGECLGFLTVDRIEIYPNACGPDLYADIVLEQDNIRYLDEAAKEFDEKFKAKELRN